ncbi:MAG TPA: hypothetical protein VF982_02130, partial [Anaerolineales bacterium]
SLAVAADDCLVGMETAHNVLIDYLWGRGYNQVYVSICACKCTIYMHQHCTTRMRPSCTTPVAAGQPVVSKMNEYTINPLNLSVR